MSTSQLLDEFDTLIRNLNTVLLGDQNAEITVGGIKKPSITKALRAYLSNNGFMPFDTEAELLAYRPNVSPFGAYSFNTKKVYRWNGTVWTNEGLSAVDSAIAHLNSVMVIEIMGNMNTPSRHISGVYVNASDKQILDYSGAITLCVPVIAGATYTMSSPNWTPSAVVFGYSETSAVVPGLKLNVIETTSVSITEKRWTVPNGGNKVKYFCIGIKLPSLNLDLTQSFKMSRGLEINDAPAFSVVSEINGSSVADSFARDELAKMVPKSDIKYNSINRYYDSVKYPNKYISLATSVVGTSAGTEMCVISVESGKEYYIYNDYWAPYGFVAGLLNSPNIANGTQVVQIVPETTSVVNVRKVTIPDGYAYLAMNTCIPSQGMDNRKSCVVNVDKYVGKYSVIGIGGASIRDDEAHRKIDNFSTNGSSPLSGKSWVAIGDSITEKNYRANNNYHDFIKQRVTDLQVFNYGRSGTGYYGRSLVAETVTQPSPDIITVFFGTNDWNNGNKPLGEFLDTTDATISGCINICITELQKKFYSSQIALFTPLARSNSWGENGPLNAMGYTMVQLCDLIKRYGNHYGVPCLDLYRKGNLPVWIPEANAKYFTAPSLTSPDGLHPNDAGHEKISHMIQKFLESL